MCVTLTCDLSYLQENMQRHIPVGCPDSKSAVQNAGKESDATAIPRCVLKVDPNRSVRTVSIGHCGQDYHSDYPSDDQDEKA